MVGELQATLTELEEQLVEEQAHHLSLMEEREQDILQLRTEVGYLDPQTPLILHPPPSPLPRSHTWRAS